MKYLNLIEIHQLYQDIYNCLLIISPKGIGKTYSAIKLCLKNYNDHQKSFCYFFRRDTELDSFLIEMSKFIDLDKFILRRKRNFALLKTKTGEIVGLLTSLSSAKYTKNFENINLLIFDEFIDIDGFYHTEEWKKFFVFISNIVRTKAKWNLYMLGNYHGQDNPYCNKFETWKWKQDKYGMYSEGGKIGLFMVDSTHFKEVIEAQGVNIFAKYDQKTSDAYLNGKFAYDNDNMIQKSEVLINKPLYNCIYNNDVIYVYLTGQNFYYFSAKNHYQSFKWFTYTLTLKDSLQFSETNLRGTELSPAWNRMLITSQAIFSTFEIRNQIVDYLNRVNNSYELKY